MRALATEQRKIAAELERLWAQVRRPAYARLGLADRRRHRKAILALERRDAELLERIGGG
ncbi:MAG: hypothetical protein LCH79_16295 [Proteobacteria bacterium]|nr:hypothetical protein [Pseudomonadota bacterium]